PHSIFSSLFLHRSAATRDLPSFPTRRSSDLARWEDRSDHPAQQERVAGHSAGDGDRRDGRRRRGAPGGLPHGEGPRERWRATAQDRKSTRLNSSHLVISYAVFCLKKKKK